MYVFFLMIACSCIYRAIKLSISHIPSTVLRFIYHFMFNEPSRRQTRSRPAFFFPSAEEKANLTRHSRPAFEWGDMAAQGSRDDTLISLDDVRDSPVEEVERKLSLPVLCTFYSFNTIVIISNKTRIA